MSGSSDPGQRKSRAAWRLLAQAGIVPDAVLPAAIDESVLKGELPRLHACGWPAKKRAGCRANMAASRPLSWPPTRWWRCGRRILPKARDDAEVRACLKLLSGRRHQVITAVALITSARQAAQPGGA